MTQYFEFHNNTNYLNGSEVLGPLMDEDVKFIVYIVKSIDSITVTGKSRVCHGYHGYLAVKLFLGY